MFETMSLAQLQIFLYMLNYMQKTGITINEAVDSVQALVNKRGDALKSASTPDTKPKAHTPVASCKNCGETANLYRRRDIDNKIVLIYGCPNCATSWIYNGGTQ